MWEIRVTAEVGRDPFVGSIEEIIRKAESSSDTLYCFCARVCGEAFSPYVLYVGGREIGIISELFVIDGDTIVIPRKSDGSPACDAPWRLHTPISSDENGVVGRIAVKEEHVKFAHLPWWSLKRPAFEDIPQFPERGKTGDFWKEYLRKYAGSEAKMYDRMRGGIQYFEGYMPKEIEDCTYVAAKISKGVTL